MRLASSIWWIFIFRWRRIHRWCWKCCGSGGWNTGWTDLSWWVMVSGWNFWQEIRYLRMWNWLAVAMIWVESQENWAEKNVWQPVTADSRAWCAVFSEVMRIRWMDSYIIPEKIPRITVRFIIWQTTMVLPWQIWPVMIPVIIWRTVRKTGTAVRTITAGTVVWKARQEKRRFWNFEEDRWGMPCCCCFCHRGLRCYTAVTNWKTARWVITMHIVRTMKLDG